MSVNIAARAMRKTIHFGLKHGFKLSVAGTILTAAHVFKPALDEDFQITAKVPAVKLDWAQAVHQGSAPTYGEARNRGLSSHVAQGLKSCQREVGFDITNLAAQDDRKAVLALTCAQRVRGDEFAHQFPGVGVLGVMLGLSSLFGTLRLYNRLNRNCRPVTGDGPEAPSPGS